MDEFYSRGVTSKDLGVLFIVLIPKKMVAENLDDFRPMSLIGCIYKILAKILANHLKAVLPSIISPWHGVFIEGR